MKASDVPALKVAELREALKELGLSTAGTKAVLAERLLAALAAAEESKGTDPPPKKTTSDASGGAPESKDGQPDSSEQPKPVEAADAALASRVVIMDVNKDSAEPPAATNERKGRRASGKPAAASTQETPDMHRQEKEPEAAQNILPGLSESPAVSRAKRRSGHAAGNTAVASEVKLQGQSKTASDQPVSSGKGHDAAALKEAVEDTAITDAKPKATGSHEAEHEEQVDYGTDDIMAVDEAPVESKTSDGQAAQQEQLIEKQDTEAPAGEMDVGNENENHSEAGKQGETEVAADTDAAATGSPHKAAAGDTSKVSEGTPNPVAVKEVVTELSPSGGGKEAADGAKDAGKQSGVADAAKTAPPDPTPPAASSGRKRQPIEFKVDEVEQRVAAKRAARETTAGEGAGLQDKAAATVADKSKTQPASTKKAPLYVAASGAAATQEKVVKAPEPPAEEEARATETSPRVPVPQAAPAEAAANAGSAAGGRAVKLQKLDSGGRKAGLANAVTEVVTARLGAPATATKKLPPQPLEGPATRALRIEGFVRPFTENQVRQFLSQHGVVDDMWMPTIKKYCYVIFAEVADGEAAAAATNGVVWPPTNATSILKPTYVSAEDAADAIANGRAGLTDTPRGGSGVLMASPKGAMAGTGPQVGAGARRDTLTAAVAAAAADTAAAKQKALPTAAATGGANATAGRKRPEPEADTAVADATGLGKTAPAEDAAPAAAPAPAPAPEPTVLSLDDLFKKTRSKPIIYWLPLTEEEAARARKKRKEEDAAAQKAEEEAERERARRQQERERERERAGERGGSGGLLLPPPPPLPGPPPRDSRGGYDRDRQGYGRDRR
ncbi:hypothetical protein Vafri_4676 [Volvox africanus]|uniref:SAP domain-containing protein n=1 Tax=Volvox africanus TaxID=51714 RepID=A0A8J4EUW5_9CHLO|nr:hypothetical protein Vafri_4676 [Volvox africanus]